MSATEEALGVIRDALRGSDPDLLMSNFERVEDFVVENRSGSTVIAPPRNGPGADLARFVLSISWNELEPGSPEVTCRGRGILGYRIALAVELGLGLYLVLWMTKYGLAAQYLIVMAFLGFFVSMTAAKIHRMSRERDHMLAAVVRVLQQL